MYAYASPEMDGETMLKGGDMLVYVAGFPAIYGKQIPYFLGSVFQAGIQRQPGGIRHARGDFPCAGGSVVFRNVRSGGAWSRHSGWIVINTTPSLPRGLYLKIDTPQGTAIRCCCVRQICRCSGGP